MNILLNAILTGLIPSVILKREYQMWLNCVFSHDVMAAIFVSQNNETAAMLVSQTSPVELNSFLMQTLSFVLINK